ncbi:RNA polymerase sigma factor [Chryseobacterium herbae]|uniref:RNA polymerase sigma factor n=1 Tax=Chryseobacterium herbae TaxID=2976476 RepID=A0ABT2IS07_9FLAO|nr:sigma-70 family RNA polymerase sigma factor [Chryseobacterium sp. pc1-10]MCT2561624.1 sigma-70 family RNA polymerase sigma factor [Chryseobacterium sp. pc1-10]
MQFNWQKIYRENSPKLLGICRRYVQDVCTAEDIVQDSFITAIQKNHQLKDEKTLFAWLKKIVVNNALQYLRKSSKEVFLTSELSEISDTSTEMIASSVIDETNHILAYNFTREELLKSIDSLPPHHKSVFNLYYIENYSHAEISSVLKIPVNTSKSHLMRAKKFVQNYLTTHFISSETQKNKTSQLLIFLGFGGLLWAQTFKSKFSDFAISPSKSFEIPSDIPLNTISLTSNNFWKQKMIIGSTLFIIIVGSVLLFSPKNSLVKALQSNISDSKSEERYFSPPEAKTDNETKTDPEEALKHTSISQKSNSETKKDAETDNSSTIKTKNIVSSKNIIKKDSADSASHKVIVVKKIIQRDTIYVER